MPDLILRDHEPVIIDKFGGLWDRGDKDNTPLDHFQDCVNVKFVGTSGFATRDGIGVSQTVNVPISNIKRIYNYPTPTGNTLIVLAVNSGNGQIYHIVNATTVFGPILTIAGMTDFAFVPYNGRAFISPFTSYTITSLSGTLNQERGLQNNFLYTYAGDGTAARLAAGNAPGGSLTIANGAAGHTDQGLHVFGVVFQTDSGFLTPPGALNSFTTSPTFSVSFSTIPLGPTGTVARQIVVSKTIINYSGIPTEYDVFFLPGGVINDNTTTTLANISFYDADLLDDATYLYDLYTSIPAGATLTLYHNRLCLGATYANISLMLVSNPGDIETISQVDGLIIVPLDGNSITNAQELRDILYVTKRARTVSYVDNGDVPSSWPLVVVDNALGSSVHGIATVIDSGSSMVDFLIICTYQGISLFNGRYITPEISWKIENFWKGQDKNNFRYIQIVNSPLAKEMYVVLPDRRVLVGNYSNGMDPKNIRWSPWSFLMGANTVAIANISDIIIGADIGV